ncbi:hypothetical protein DSO57_1027100 [Entomophthora muscae]|uniref:Uncharacterized protein n=1 Tax=Entomophthora muscae TaxID=34485 RepID=A0ACC2SQT8_9FUNG|nr:hypothetical protein DSO57_1027100 [Entomophthora muscae]
MLGMTLDFVFLGVAVVGVVMNLLLITLALRAKHELKEIKMVVGLALVDLVVPLLSIGCVVYHLVTKQDIANGCNVKGVIDFGGVFLSMLLVSIISLVRCSVILNWRIPTVLKLFLAGFVSVYFCLVALCASLEEFYVLEAEIYCSPISTTSPISMAVLLLHASALLVFLTITVTSYTRILISIVLSATPEEFVSLHSMQSKDSSWVTRKPVLIRTSAIIISYLFIVLPPSILLFIEAILQQQVASSLNTPIDLFLVSISILNPTLVLFAHSIIFQQLMILFRQGFR